MDQTVVKATEGRALGTRPSRRLRAEGNLPGVVYGLGKDPQTVSVSYADLRHALSGKAGMNTVLTLDIDGSQQMVLVRSVQRDPIKRVVTHADFLRVEPGKKVRVKVPIELVLVADLSRLTVDSRISVGDLNLPEGSSTPVSEDISVAAAVISRAAKMAAEEEALEEAEGEEVEGGESEDGAADEGDADAGDAE